MVQLSTIFAGLTQCLTIAGAAAASVTRAASEFSLNITATGDKEHAQQDITLEARKEALHHRFHGHLTTWKYPDCLQWKVDMTNDHLFLPGQCRDFRIHPFTAVQAYVKDPEKGKNQTRCYFELHEKVHCMGIPELGELFVTEDVVGGALTRGTCVVHDQHHNFSTKYWLSARFRCESTEKEQNTEKKQVTSEPDEELDVLSKDDETDEEPDVLNRDDEDDDVEE